MGALRNRGLPPFSRYRSERPQAITECLVLRPEFPGGCMFPLIASRRDFLKITGAGVAGTALASTASGYSRILGANDQVRVAVCGVRGRGHDHIRGFARVANTQLAALCDVDESVLSQRLENVEK